MDRKGSYGNSLSVELPLEFLRPKDNGELRKAISGHLWPHIILAFTVEIIYYTKLDSWGEESVSPG